MCQPESIVVVTLQVPGFEPDKQCTNDNRGRDRVKTSKTRRKEKLKDRKKQKALLMEGPVHGSFLNSPNGKENIGKLLDTPISPVEMIQFGSLSPGLLEGSFQDLHATNGALDSCKAKLRARKHALCQQSSQGPYQLNEEDFPPLNKFVVSERAVTCSGHNTSMNQRFSSGGRFEMDLTPNPI